MLKRFWTIFSLGEPDIRLYTHKHTDIHTYTSTYYCKKSKKLGWKSRSTRSLPILVQRKICCFHFDLNWEKETASILSSIVFQIFGPWNLILNFPLVSCSENQVHVFTVDFKKLFSFLISLHAFSCSVSFSRTWSYFWFAFSIKYLSSAISTFKGASFSSKVTLSSSTIVWFADTLTQKWQLDRLTQQKNK